MEVRKVIRRVKTRIILLALLLGAISFAAYSTVSAFLSPSLVLEKQEGLGEQDLIVGRAFAEGDAFHLGDIILYLVEVKYNPQRIEIIGSNVIFEPFEIRDTKEKDFKIDSNTRMYFKKYEIQLLDGWANHLYSFPAITVRYKLLGSSSSWTDYRITPLSIFIGSRIPPGVAGLDLKQTEGRVVNTSRQTIPWLLMGLGVFCGAWGVTEVFRRIRNRKKGVKEYQKRLEGIEDIFNAYQSLLKKEAEPKLLLHQAHQILRTLLSRKEGVDSSPIQHEISRLLALCQKAYNQESLEQKELTEDLQELGKIFDFYIERGEVQ